MNKDYWNYYYHCKRQNVEPLTMPHFLAVSVQAILIGRNGRPPSIERRA